MKNYNELEALNNCLNSNNLTGYKIHEYFQEDKRKTKQMYFLTDAQGNSITGKLDYSHLNYFIMGYGKAFNKFKEDNAELRSSLKEIRGTLINLLDKYQHHKQQEYSI